MSHAPVTSPENAAAFARMAARVKPHQRVFAAKVFDLAEQVDALLARRQMTRRDLARLLGKHDSEISRWFSGLHNLTFETLAKLETALETDLLVTPHRPEGYFGRNPKGAGTASRPARMGAVLPSSGAPPALRGAAIMSGALHDFMTDQLRSGGQQFQPARPEASRSRVSNVVTNG